MGHFVVFEATIEAAKNTSIEDSIKTTGAGWGKTSRGRGRRGRGADQARSQGNDFVD